MQPGTPFVFDGFIAMSFPARGLYSSDDAPLNSYLGKEYSKHIIFDEISSQSGWDYKTVCKLSNDAEKILQTAKKLLAKDNIVLHSYWAEMAGETFDMPIEMTAKGKRLSSEKSIYTIRLKHGLKEVEITSEVSPAIHPYTLGVHCSYDVQWHPGEV
ncbi:MAG: hypothetical protein IJS31_04075 [Oscillospiraceae bacterium]|nr:hypothetical protein [Oscillospiraceae bacterium]